jgi:hypothetical protein
MSLGKYVKKMSSVFKREKPSKSVPSVTPTAPSSPQGQPQPAEEEPAEVAVTTVA